MPEVFKLLKSLRKDEEWQNVVDKVTGYDILQLAVLSRYVVAALRVDCLLLARDVNNSL